MTVAAPLANGKPASASPRAAVTPALEPENRCEAQSVQLASGRRIELRVTRDADDQIVSVSVRDLRLQTAFEEVCHAHEAGPRSRVTLWMVQPGVGGGACLACLGADEDGEPEQPEWTRDEARLHVRYAAAGPLGVSIGFNVPAPPVGLDARILDRALDRLVSLGETRADVKRELLAQTEKSLRANWDRIVACAFELFSKGTLGPDEVRRMLWGPQ